MESFSVILERQLPDRNLPVLQTCRSSAYGEINRGRRI